MHDKGTERCLRYLHYREAVISFLSETITLRPAMLRHCEDPDQLIVSKPTKKKTNKKHVCASTCMYKLPRNQGKRHGRHLGKKYRQAFATKFLNTSSENSIKSCNLIFTLQLNIHLPATPPQTPALSVLLKINFVGLKQDLI